MSTLSPSLALQLEADLRGWAVRAASSAHVQVQPHARVLAMVKMAGEDTSCQIVALGRVGTAPEICSVAYPPDRAEQAKLYRWLAKRLVGYIRKCHRRGTYPQIWVSSPAVIEHLDTLCEYLRYNKKDRYLRALGRRLSYLTQRSFHAGQQCLLSVTGVLTDHFRVGQMPGENQHLGALLSWYDRDPQVSVLDAVEAAEMVPLGVSTDPTFDSEVLAPHIDDYHRAYDLLEKTGGTLLNRRLVRQRRAQIRADLEPIVRRTYDATQRGIAIFQAAQLPPLPDLWRFQQREWESFNLFMTRFRGGWRIALQDKPRAAVFEFSMREQNQKDYEIALVMGDAKVRVQKVFAGDVLRGKIRDRYQAPVGNRLREHLVLHTLQADLRLRVGDRLHWVDYPYFEVEVVSLQDVVRGSRSYKRLDLCVWAGMNRGKNSPGIPPLHTQMDLMSDQPRFDRWPRMLGRLKDALDQTSWTLGGASLPSPPKPLSVQKNLLAEVQGLV